jgi:hypothetical protein
MKRLGVIVLVLVVGLAAVGVRWAWPRQGYATPAECVEAYREAMAAGDWPRYLSCLGEPTRSINEQQAGESVFQGKSRGWRQGLKGWTQSPEFEDGSTALVLVDEVRESQTRRIRFRLQRSEKGWLIVESGPAKVVPTPIPYGTHVGKEPEEPAKE